MCSHLKPHPFYYLLEKVKWMFPYWENRKEKVSIFSPDLDLLIFYLTNVSDQISKMVPQLAVSVLFSLILWVFILSFATKIWRSASPLKASFSQFYWDLGWQVDGSRWELQKTQTRCTGRPCISGQKTNWLWKSGQLNGAKIPLAVRQMTWH